jgi:apolipoprotein N-acyltransferase
MPVLVPHIQTMQSEAAALNETSIQSAPSTLQRLAFGNKIFLCLAAGCVLGLSSPGIDLWPIAWFGLVPLLLIIQSCRGQDRAIVAAAVFGFTFGLGYNLVALSWYLGLYPLAWLGLNDIFGIQAAGFVWLAESAHQALLYAGFAAFLCALPIRGGFFPHYERPFLPYLIAAPLIWIFFQWIVGPSQAFLGTPVNMLAYSQANQIALIQIAKLGGSQLVEILLVLANCTLAAIIAERTKLVPDLFDRADRFSNKAGVFVDLAIVAALIITSLAWGKLEVDKIVLRSQAVGKSAPFIPVACVQGNISIEDERIGLLAPGQIAKRYTDLSTARGVSLLVLPEGVINAPQMVPGLLAEKLAGITSHEKKEAIFGEIISTKDSAYNACAILNEGLTQKTIYCKRRLVPFGEYLPFSSLINSLPTQVRDLLMAGGEPFLPADRLTVLTSNNGKVGASICVEIIYPHLIADEVRHGGSLLVNVANLGWFHHSTLGRQILACTQLRAVENGRYIILSANTGISAFVNPAGMVTSQSQSGKAGILLDTVQFLYNFTPYTKMWWL